MTIIQIVYMTYATCRAYTSTELKASAQTFSRCEFSQRFFYSIFLVILGLRRANDPREVHLFPLILALNATRALAAQSPLWLAMMGDVGEGPAVEE
jgi:hypothetical protein